MGDSFFNSFCWLAASGFSARTFFDDSRLSDEAGVEVAAVGVAGAGEQPIRNRMTNTVKYRIVQYATRSS